MKQQIEMISLKMKESILVSILLICLFVLIIIPLLLIASLRMLFKIYQVLRTNYILSSHTNGGLKEAIN